MVAWRERPEADAVLWTRSAVLVYGGPGASLYCVKQTCSMLGEALGPAYSILGVNGGALLSDPAVRSPVCRPAIDAQPGCGVQDRQLCAAPEGQLAGHLRWSVFRGTVYGI